MKALLRNDRRWTIIPLLLVLLATTSLPEAEAQVARRRVVGAAARTQEFPPLDKPYQNLRHPMVVSSARIPFASDTLKAVGYHTEVKAQGGRGACSIFSATALIEALLVKVYGFPRTIDLSEEWLEYLMMDGRTEDGSNSISNFTTLARFGTVREQAWPYIGEDWTTLPTPLAQKRCGHLLDRVRKTSCLLAHRDTDLVRLPRAELFNQNSPSFDPEFFKIRTEAEMFRDRYLTRHLTPPSTVFSTAEVKALLAQGHPLTLDISFFYGAWNHRGATELGIERRADHWAQGIVGYPERGSVDRQRSPQKPAGHSVVVVGYDDRKIVTIQQRMVDGSVREFTHKGVYYFKNSWGKDSFGVDFTLDGQRFPGYGMMIQDYAHEFGAFYKVGLAR